MEVDTELRPPVLSRLAEKLGYTLRDWQAQLTENILQGNDIVLTAGTGHGKTTILYAPLLVKRFHNPTAIGLSVVPTKALGLDQVCFLPVHCVITEYISRNTLQSQRGSQLLPSMRTLFTEHQVRAGTYSMRYWSGGLDL